MALPIEPLIYALQQIRDKYHALESQRDVICEENAMLKKAVTDKDNCILEFQKKVRNLKVGDPTEWLELRNKFSVLEAKIQSDEKIILSLVKTISDKNERINELLNEITNLSERSRKSESQFSVTIKISPDKLRSIAKLYSDASASGEFAQVSAELELAASLIETEGKATVAHPAYTVTYLPESADASQSGNDLQNSGRVDRESSSS